MTWAREDPPGGGPLAGVAAGVAVVATDLVAVVAGDMPYAGPALLTLVAALRTAPPEVGAVVAVDAHGVPNPLLAAYRTASVRQALPVPAASRPAKLLLAVPHVEIAITGPAGRDVDTRADLDDLDRPRRPALTATGRHPACDVLCCWPAHHLPAVLKPAYAQAQRTLTLRFV